MYEAKLKGKNDLVIGVVGGMGSYATAYFFKHIIDSFPAEKEWERPRIIIDNKCTMPSRVRAILYNESKELLIDELTESVGFLISSGANKVILACNTSHFFLENIFERIPEAREKTINIIEECAKKMVDENVDNAFLLATEGTISSGIYNEMLKQYGIECVSPIEDDFKILRAFIESVKQNKISNDIKESFVSYINQIREKNIILGCTELPILYHESLNGKDLINKNIFDPLDIVIEVLKEKWCK